MDTRNAPCWQHTGRAAPADAATWGRAYELAQAQAHSELHAIWGGLPTSQQRVLASLAAGVSPYGKARNGGSRGGSIRVALDALIARGELTAADEIVDPLLAAWVRSLRSGDVR